MLDRRFNQAFLLLLVAGISLLFYSLIRSFLLTVLLGGIFAGMASPLYLRFRSWFRGRRSLASAVTVGAGVLVVFVPFLLFLGIVVAQAISVTQSVSPVVADLLQRTQDLPGLVDSLPFAEQLEPYREEILTRLGQLVGGLGGFLVASLSSTTGWTVSFLFHFLLMLACMYYFLIDGDRILERILYYLPLDSSDEQRLVDRFVSVTRATLKGTLVIGAIQGAASGAALAVAGIPQAVFWGAVMTVLSIIPGIGTGLVWFPAGAYLILTGHTASGVLLIVFCGAVVGSVDNVLRPRLVGRDTQMHDLLILLSTLGGISMFGVVGFIVGPLIAALFVTVWDIYGTAFRDYLPAVRGSEASTTTPGGSPDPPDAGGRRRP